MSDEACSQPVTKPIRPRLASKARLQTDKLSGKPGLLYPEGVLLLNPTGAAIVQLCDGRRTLMEMLASLAERYQEPPHQLAHEVMVFLGRLRDRGLVELPAEEDTEP
jgi:pyrroloquinoline quinone biosynthesis protein D